MAITAQQEGFRSLLKKKDFLRLWLAQLISMTILNASNYALLVLIEEVTGSTTLVGLAIICFSLPALILGAPAGVFVDRLNKRRVLWISNLLRAIATFLFVVSLIWNQHQLVPIYLLTFLISSIGQFFTPAEGSTIPLLVSEEELMPALSLFNITFMLSQALGFILFAPILLSLLPTFSIVHVVINPVETLYAIIALLYIVCAVLITFIPAQRFTQSANRKKQRISTQQLEAMGSIWQETVQGWTFIRGNKQLFLAVIQLSFAGVLLLVIGELATPIVTKLLLLSPDAMAFIFAPAGIGLVAGSVVMPRITTRMGKSRAIITGSITVTLVALFLPFSTIIARLLEPHGWNTNPLLLIIVALLMFAAGVALDFINIPAQTAIQQQTPDWIKGRVLALQLMLYNAFAIPIILFIGAFADIFGLDRVLYLMAVCIIAFGLWGIYYERKHPNIITPIKPDIIEPIQTR
ncbi:MAG TPA: MFS transporter [Ktedonobacteraceae bacterium]|nr:MFS transporter [Ktedonobacteraceae bacterium]